MKLFDFAVLAWLLNRHARQTMPTDRLRALEAAEAAAAAEKAREKAESQAMAVIAIPCFFIGAGIYYWLGFNLTYTIVALVVGFFAPIPIAMLLLTYGKDQPDEFVFGLYYIVCTSFLMVATLRTIWWLLS